ncbi:STAS domain-containing protein [Catellatospora vulcania]|uniref:STAS domain-containing protein n=1 Tax=Catellatospora vulcania TaxID=1460450 RepID=UPI001E619507|nr:STAS domain-containing protein [Catellatospora vulcania]
MMNTEGSAFSIERQLDATRLSVVVHGDLDLATADLLRAELCDAVKQSPEVAVDFSRVTFLDSTGIRALVEGFAAAKELGHVIYVEGATGWVDRVMEVTGMRTLLARPA